MKHVLQNSNSAYHYIELFYIIFIHTFVGLIDINRRSFQGTLKKA